MVHQPFRIIINLPVKHDGVVIVPELFGKEDDWDLFYKLVEEMRCIQSSNSDSNPDSNPDSNSDNTKQPLSIRKHIKHRRHLPHVLRKCAVKYKVAGNSK